VGVFSARFTGNAYVVFTGTNHFWNFECVSRELTADLLNKRMPRHIKDIAAPSGEVPTCPGEATIGPPRF